MTFSLKFPLNLGYLLLLSINKYYLPIEGSIIVDFLKFNATYA